MVSDTPPSQDTYTHQIWNSYLKEYKRYALNTIILKVGQSSRSQRPEMVFNIPSFQDTFKHQIWNSYLKENKRYAPGSMQFLETMTEVKFKVTVTQLRYATLPHPKIHSHTKFESPTSNNI